MPNETKKKILRIGFLTPARNLEPQIANDVESSFVVRHIFETPFGDIYGSTEIEPRLFSGPLRRRNVPGTVFEAEVRKDIRFSDGSLLTPADVLRCLREFSFIQEDAEANLEGERIVLALKRPNARFDLALSHYQCSVSRSVGGRLIGTGPYQVAPDSQPQLVRLVKNPHYRKPIAIDEVHFVTYPPDADGRAAGLIAAIEKGEVDISLSLGRDDIDAVKGVRKVLLPGVSLAMLYLNCESPHLKDRRLRSAIAYAIDRLAITACSYANPLAFAATSLTPRPLGPADVSLTFDLNEAKAILAAGDVSLPEKLVLRMMWGPRPYLPYPQRVADLIAEQIGKLGIRVEFRPTASSTEFLETSLAGSYDMTLAGWIADTMDPCDFLESNLSSGRIPRPDNIAVASNLGRFRSQEMDRAIARYRGERLEEHLDVIIDIVNREVPLLPLMYGPAASVRSYRVAGFKPTSLWFVPAEELDVMD